MIPSAKPYRRRANYYETDKMGIIHHSNYIRWFEEARFDYMKQLGMSYEQMERDGIMMPVIDVNCKYRNSVLFDEEFEVITSLASFNGVKAYYKYEIYSVNSGKLAVTGKSGHCFLDENTRLPLNLKKKYRDFYDKCLELLKLEKEASIIERSNDSVK